MCDEADKQFFDRCADYVGELSSSDFNAAARKAYQKCQSAIEKVFYVAFVTLMEANHLCPLSRAVNLPNGWELNNGIEVVPQAQLGEYRVDFLLNFYGETFLRNRATGKTLPPQPLRRLVVEVDGHGFHDRDAEQRAYENERNRFLQKEGYEIFHFTGREVNSNPMKVALDCLSCLAGKKPFQMFCPDVQRVFAGTGRGMCRTCVGVAAVL